VDFADKLIEHGRVQFLDIKVFAYQGCKLPLVSLIKIDDTFYTGTYGVIASFNPVTGEQYLWVKN